MSLLVHLPHWITTCGDPGCSSKQSLTMSVPPPNHEAQWDDIGHMV